MRLLKKAWISFILLIMIDFMFDGAFQKLEAGPITLPKTVGKWTRAGSVKTITADTIFDYMDGAGELYLGYRFNHLDVYEYECRDGGDNIQVEVYDMETSDDAFGLLSLDWDGEAISGRQYTGRILSDKNHLKSPAAIYGAGLLRLWADRLYARIIVYRESPEAKQTIIDLGKALEKGRKPSPVPAMIIKVPENIGNIWKLRPDRVSFFRSYSVLNSIYYISHENILDLDNTTEAVAAAYDHLPDDDYPKPAQLIWIHYESSHRAVQAMRHFHEAYLSDVDAELSPKAAESQPQPVFVKLEEGWLAYKLSGEYLTIVSGCPSRESAGIIIERNWEK